MSTIKHKTVVITEMHNNYSIATVFMAHFNCMNMDTIEVLCYAL